MTKNKKNYKVNNSCFEGLDTPFGGLEANLVAKKAFVGAYVKHTDLKLTFFQTFRFSVCDYRIPDLYAHSADPNPLKSLDPDPDKLMWIRNTFSRYVFFAL